VGFRFRRGDGGRFRGLGPSRKYGFKFPKEFGNIPLADDEGREQPKDVIVRAVDQQSLAERLLHERRAIN
jgi:hypothetical protein